jgi:hypothetical protein
MKNLTNRISEISKHLQSLSTPAYCNAVEEAAAKKDKKALLEVCSKANIPRAYRSSIVSVVLSVDPQKYPLEM